MEASDIYKCIADPQRLRILNLLEAGPLCVCHLQEILEASQVKISKQLAGMKQLGLVHSTREGTWMVYHLTSPAPSLLETNLNHLRTAQCCECNQLQQDLAQRGQLIQRITKTEVGCPGNVCEQLSC